MDDHKINQLTDRTMRQREDVLKGLSRAKGAQRGDFKLCREADKILKDYREFKSPKDREKIKAEYFGLQKEYRKEG